MHFKEALLGKPSFRSTKLKVQLNYEFVYFLVEIIELAKLLQAIFLKTSYIFENFLVFEGKFRKIYSLLTE